MTVKDLLLVTQSGWFYFADVNCDRAGVVRYSKGTCIPSDHEFDFIHELTSSESSYGNSSCNGSSFSRYDQVQGVTRGGLTFDMKEIWEPSCTGMPRRLL